MISQPRNFDNWLYSSITSKALRILRNGPFLRCGREGGRMKPGVQFHQSNPLGICISRNQARKMLTTTMDGL